MVFKNRKEMLGTWSSVVPGSLNWPMSWTRYMGHVNQGGPWDLQCMSKHDLRLQAEVRGMFCCEPCLKSQWGLTL